MLINIDRENKIILAFLLLMIGLSILNFQNIYIPILHQIVFFICITFLPGFLILKNLLFNNKSNMEIILLSIGLSISFLMILGFLINMTYPHLNITNPISFYPLCITIIIVLIFLFFISLLNGSQLLFQKHDSYNFKLWPLLLLVLLPIISVIGAYFITYYDNNILTLFLDLFIVIIVFSIAINKFISEDMYPIALFFIGLSLLFQYSVVTDYIIGADIHQEYYLQNIVSLNSLWDSSYPNNINAMLSITLLSPIYSKLMLVGPNFVFKIIYMILFSFVPVILFKNYLKFFNKKICFFSIFLFLSFNRFMQSMSSERQVIAEIFLSLIILFLFNKKIKWEIRIILIIFAFSLTVSHYGTSYIFLFYLLLFIVFFLPVITWERFKDIVKNHSKNFKQKILIKFPISPFFIVLFIIFIISWYAYISSSKPFISVINIGDHILKSFSEFLNPTTRETQVLLAIGLSENNYSPLSKIFLYLQYTIQFFIVIGILYITFAYKDNIKNFIKNRIVYLLFVLPAFFILIICIIIPNFSSKLGINRVFHIMLFFISPLFVLGIIISLKKITNIFKKLAYLLLRKNYKNNNNIKIFSVLTIVILLIFYFLFNIGFIYQITDNKSKVFYLNIGEVDNRYFNKGEIFGSKFIANHREKEFIVFADEYRKSVIFSQQGLENFDLVNSQTFEKNNKYLFLGTWNIENKEFLLKNKNESRIFYKYIKFDKNIIFNSNNINNKIYENIKSSIYLI